MVLAIIFPFPFFVAHFQVSLIITIKLEHDGSFATIHFDTLVKFFSGISKERFQLAVSVMIIIIYFIHFFLLLLSYMKEETGNCFFFHSFNFGNMITSSLKCSFWVKECSINNVSQLFNCSETSIIFQ